MDRSFGRPGVTQGVALGHSGKYSCLSRHLRTCHVISRCNTLRSAWGRTIGMGIDDVQWMSTADAAKRLGITPRTLYRFIDEGQLPAYRFGRVIRLKQTEVDSFIETCKIQPGTVEHLYPDAAPATD